MYWDKILLPIYYIGQIYREMIKFFNKITKNGFNTLMILLYRFFVFF